MKHIHIDITHIHLRTLTQRQAEAWENCRHQEGEEEAMAASVPKRHISAEDVKILWGW
jgi:hypothetical protein